MADFYLSFNDLVKLRYRKFSGTNTNECLAIVRLWVQSSRVPFYFFGGITSIFLTIDGGTSLYLPRVLFAGSLMSNKPHDRG